MADIELDQLAISWSDTARELNLLDKSLADIKSHTNDVHSSASNISPRSYHFLRVLRPSPVDPDLLVLTAHLKRLGRLSKRHILAFEKLFQLPDQTRQPQEPLRARPESLETRTPEIKSHVHQDPFSLVVDWNNLSNPQKSDHALKHFFRLADWLADPSARTAQPPAAVLGAFSRTWNLFAQLNPDAYRYWSRGALPSFAVDLERPMRKLDLKRADVVRPPSPMKEDGAETDNTTSDEDIWSFGDRFDELHLDESPLARLGDSRRAGVREPKELEPGASKTSDATKGDQISDEDGPKRTHTESVVADLLASLVDALVSTLLNGPYIGVASTTDQIRFTLGGRESDPPTFRLTACVDGYIRISDPQGCPFVAVFEVKARSRPIFNRDSIDQVRRQEAAEIAAMEFAYGNRTSSDKEEGRSKRTGQPPSQILISATPEGIYISVAEKPHGWQSYICDGNNRVCPRDKRLGVYDMLTVWEYGPLRLENRLHLKTFGFIIAALLACHLDRRQGAGSTGFK